MYFFSGLYRSAVAAPLVEAQYVAAVGMLCEHSTEGAGGAELVVKHPGEGRTRP